MTTDSLVGAAVHGDPDAVNEVLRWVRPLVVRYCRARLGRRETFASADDVAQEVCLAVLTALPSYRDQGRPFLAFVYGIAAHKVADAHRWAARNRAEPVPEIPDSPTLADGPEQRFMQSESAEQMNRLLETLPDKQREILILRVVVGLSAEETAEMVGSTPGAVRVAQHRVLNQLRKILATGGITGGLAGLGSLGATAARASGAAVVTPKPRRTIRHQGGAMTEQQPVQPIQNPLTLLMRAKSPQDFVALKHTVEKLQAMPSDQNPVTVALDKIGTVHFARFAFIEDHQQLAVITVYDGDFEVYLNEFINAIGDVFNKLLSFVEDAPPLPVQTHRQEFFDYVRAHDLCCVQPFYSAYPQYTVLDIRDMASARS